MRTNDENGGTDKGAGFRLPVSWLAAFRDLRSATGIPQQQVFEDAIAMHFGKTDPLAELRREMVIKAFRSGKVKRPFESPLIPSNSSAVVIG